MLLLQGSARGYLGLQHKIIEIEAFVDNKSVIEAILSTRLVEDKRLRIDIAANKESLQFQDVKRILEDHWSCSSPERLSHCKLMRFKLIENRPMKVYAWTLLTPGAWPNLTQGHDWHNL